MNPDVLESKYTTMILAVLDNLLKMIPPTMSEGQGNTSRELGRYKVRDRDNNLERGVEM